MIYGHVLRKIASALLTTLLFTTGMSLLMMNSHYNFAFYFIAVGFYSFIVNCFLGIPSSLLIDYILHRLQFTRSYVKTIISIVLYMIFACISVIIFVLYHSVENFFLLFSYSLLFYGIIAALVFMCVDKGIKKVTDKLRK